MYVVSTVPSHHFLNTSHTLTHPSTHLAVCLQHASHTTCATFRAASNRPIAVLCCCLYNNNHNKHCCYNNHFLH